MTRSVHARLAAVSLGLALLACSPAANEWSGLPWIENDYEAALALAQERDLPIFVESWAPW